MLPVTASLIAKYFPNSLTVFSTEFWGASLPHLELTQGSAQGSFAASPASIVGCCHG